MKPIRSIIAFAALSAFLSFSATSLGGQDHPPWVGEHASQWHSSEHARVRLIRGGVTQDGRDVAGLVIELEEGWHTYWRSPGALGLPPTFNWEGSENIRGVEVEWPMPRHIVQGDYETFGYEERVVLPLLVTRDDAQSDARINLALGYAVCETVCIPALGFVSMALPATVAEDEALQTHAATIEEARATVPTRDLGAAGIEAVTAHVAEGDRGAPEFRLTVLSQQPLDVPAVIPEGPKGMRFGRTQIEITSGGRRLEAVLPYERDPAADGPAGSGVVITVAGGRLPVTFPLATVLADSPVSPRTDTR